MSIEYSYMEHLHIEMHFKYLIQYMFLLKKMIAVLYTCPFDVDISDMKLSHIEAHF